MYYQDISSITSSFTGMYVTESEIEEKYRNYPVSACAIACFKYVCDEFTVLSQDGAASYVCHLRNFNSTAPYDN